MWKKKLIWKFKKSNVYSSFVPGPGGGGHGGPGGHDGGHDSDGSGEYDRLGKFSKSQSLIGQQIRINKNF